MPRPNPYQTPDGVYERTSSPHRPPANTKIVRGLEYVIAMLIVMALIWVVHVFVLRGNFLG